MQTKFRRFTESYDAAINAVDDNRPFLTEDIHTQLMAALNAARAEHIDVWFTRSGLALLTGTRQAKRTWQRSEAI